MKPIFTKLKLTELKRDTLSVYKNKKKIPVKIVLDNIRSMNNVGSVFRTCDAFLIDEIHLCGITSTPPNKEIHKTALGATDSVKWRYFDKTEDSLNILKSDGYRIIAVEQTKESIPLNKYDVEENSKNALIFGNEVNGVDQDILNIADTCIEIPQFGTKHSLNVSVSAAIVIWDFFLKIAD
jgi:23S rRNA (guanosine2251-2'-O)-methyltransferase